MIPLINPIHSRHEAQKVAQLILDGSWLTEFEKTKEFEKDICTTLGVRYCSAVSNGTLGLILALKACGIGVGDHVACPALTMIATATAISMVGAIPIFVDTDKAGCMDILRLKEEVDAVVYVSLNGRAGKIKDVVDYCKYKKIYLIEDACQSIGSKVGETYLGTFGDIGVFSLSPHKLISTGQGGLIVTNNGELAKRVNHLKDFGRTKGGIDKHPYFGINAKFTDLQAVIGIEQLKYLEDRAEVKKLIYKSYQKKLGKYMKPHRGTPWFVDIYVDNSQMLHDYLKGEEIETRLMYPIIPHEGCYKEAGSYPNAQDISYKGLWLPSALNLTEGEISLICEKVKEFLGNDTSGTEKM